MQKRGKYVQTIESTSANGTEKTLWSCIWVFIWTQYKIKPTKTSENGNLKPPIISLWANHPSTINCDLRFFEVFLHFVKCLPLKLQKLSKVQRQLVKDDFVFRNKLLLTWTRLGDMEDGGVDTAFIDWRQQKMGQMAGFLLV